MYIFSTSSWYALSRGRIHVYTCIWGEGNTVIISEIGVNTAMLGRFGFCQPQNRVWQATGKKRPSATSRIRKSSPKNKWPRQPTLPAPDIGFRRAESVVYLFGWSFLPVLIWLSSFQTNNSNRVTCICGVTFVQRWHQHQIPRDNTCQPHSAKLHDDEQKDRFEPTYIPNSRKLH